MSENPQNKQTPQSDAVKEMTDSWLNPANMAEPVKTIGVTFEKISFPDFDVEHTIISKNETLSEIVFHMTFKTLSRMEEVSEFLAKEIPRMGMDGPIVRASRNPEYRSNWDMMIERVEKTNAAYYRDRILQLLGILTRNP
jgi:hypothetical protein